MTIYLVQCGRTDWRAEGRLQGRLSMPLSQAGREEAEAVARQLAGIKLKAVHCPPCEACRQTADVVAAGHRGCKVRLEDDLQEVDLGLWQGMLIEQVKRRQPRVYRQWIEQPLTVTPPGGEGFESAYRRVSATIRRVVGQAGKSAAIAVVAPPLVAGLIRCHLSAGSLSDVWKLVGGEPVVAEQFSPESAQRG